jgi:hypothetical protein
MMELIAHLRANVLRNPSRWGWSWPIGLQAEAEAEVGPLLSSSSEELSSIAVSWWNSEWIYEAQGISVVCTNSMWCKAPEKLRLYQNASFAIVKSRGSTTMKPLGRQSGYGQSKHTMPNQERIRGKTKNLSRKCIKNIHNEHKSCTKGSNRGSPCCICLTCPFPSPGKFAGLHLQQRQTRWHGFGVHW